MANRSRQSDKPRVRKAVDPALKESPGKQPKDGPVFEGPKKLTNTVQSPAFKPLLVAARFLKRILRFLVPRYLINAWREVRQVSWPNRRETWRLTAAVFVFAVIFGGLVAAVDKGLDELFKKVVLK